MILVRTAEGSPRYATWTEQEAESIDELVAEMETALETEDGFATDREYEVIRVEVVRRVKVSRKVVHTPVVSVTEVEEVAA